MEKWEQGTRNRSGARVRSYTGSDRLGCRLSCQKTVTHYYGITSGCLVPFGNGEEGSIPTHDWRTGKDGAKYMDGRAMLETVRCAARSSEMPQAKPDNIWDDIDDLLDSDFATQTCHNRKRRKRRKPQYKPTQEERERIQRKNLELMRENQARKEAAIKARKERELAERVAKIRAMSNCKHSGETTTAMVGGW